MVIIRAELLTIKDEIRNEIPLRLERSQLLAEFLWIFRISYKKVGHTLFVVFCLSNSIEI